MKQSEFFSRVYKIVAGIPAGRVMTYGQIAVLLGMPGRARMVGQAMFNTPAFLEIPAHRVVNSKGSLAPDHVFGGSEVQKRLLEEEGVVFRPNGCIDLKKSVYHS